MNITIMGRKWFDRINGNTYCSSKIFIDGEHVHTIPMTYGYGDYYRQMSMEWLADNGHIPADVRHAHNSALSDAGITVVSECSKGLKRELYK